jgi:NAD(P)-dependent dehydrogenase (short-subunit alcohol dehydrogenase family)
VSTSQPGRRVVVVTGGGSGIGAAIATELGRLGDHVVTVDPLVSVDGSELLQPPERTTAARIVASGGSARASNLSVTDRDGIAALFADLVEAHGRVDAVVNVAGITRPTGFARGEEQDWSAVLSVHLEGYRNVLEAALPIMADAGRGDVVGVTSGSGWRAADAGAYSCAKRAVASLTWQLGRIAPAGVRINAVSPIALTRMITAALGRAGAAAARPGGSSATGGLSLGSMPEPEELGPLGAFLAGHGAAELRGQVLFAGGSEVAVVDPPRVLEVVRTSEVGSIESVVRAFADTLAAAEAAQATTGGANARFDAIFDRPVPRSSDGPAPATAIVSDRPELAAAIAGTLEAAGAPARVVPAGSVTAGFDAARSALAATADTLGGLDAVVVALATATMGSDGAGWEGVLASHADLGEQVLVDAGWARAAADHSAASGRPLRLVTVTDAATPGGRSRAQAAAQLARASRKATGDRVAAFSIAMRGRGDADTVAALVSELVTATRVGLAGAELVTGPGWLGLCSHPKPAGSIVFGGPALPDWFAAVLEEQCR